MSDTKPNSALYSNMVASSVAAVFQTTISHPFEFLKTGQQLHRSLPNVESFNMFHHVKSYFAGCSALNIGILLKTSTRFTTFDKACEMLKNPENPEAPISGLRLIAAGSITGFMESLLIIPFENIKTRMIENAVILSNRFQEEQQTKRLEQQPKSGVQKNATQERPTFHKPSKSNLNPRYEKFLYYEKHPSSNIFSTVKEMMQTRGFASFFQGSMPTIFRQMGNSVVRFTTYTALKQMISPDKPLKEYYAFGIGVFSSCAVVALTQPIDVVKTRMQSKYTWSLYKNSLNCVYRTFIEEGLASLWKGWVPRLFKVGLSGGVSFGMYQYVDNLMLSIEHQRSLSHD